MNAMRLNGGGIESHSSQDDENAEDLDEPEVDEVDDDKLLHEVVAAISSVFTGKDEKHISSLLALMALCFGTDTRSGLTFGLASNRQIAGLVFNRGNSDMLVALKKCSTSCNVKLPDASVQRCSEEDLNESITTALKAPELRVLKASMNKYVMLCGLCECILFVIGVLLCTSVYYSCRRFRHRYDNKFRNYVDGILGGGVKLLTRIGDIDEHLGPDMSLLVEQYRAMFGEESLSENGGVVDILSVLKLGTVESLNFSVYKIITG